MTIAKLNFQWHVFIKLTTVKSCGHVVVHRTWFIKIKIDDVGIILVDWYIFACVVFWQEKFAHYIAPPFINSSSRLFSCANCFDRSSCLSLINFLMSMSSCSIALKFSTICSLNNLPLFIERSFVCNSFKKSSPFKNNYFHFKLPQSVTLYPRFTWVRDTYALPGPETSKTNLPLAVPAGTLMLTVPADCQAPLLTI